MAGIGWKPRHAYNGAMPHIEMTLRCAARDEERVERALADIGALSITLLDADADSGNERAILEPGVGEMPLWADCVMCALFDAGTDPTLVLQALEAFDPGIDLGSATFREVEEQDWVRAWMDQFQPMRFGRRVWIVPSEHALPAEADVPGAAVVRLDPGLAFGSGTHPTTALCLAWLDSLSLEGQTVLDFGCGSGILALAALKLGATAAVGVDNDPQAILATRDNALRNGVGERLEVFLPEDAPTQAYPVVVANILAVALDTLADTIASRVQTGGCLALSGILVGQEQALLDRYARWFESLSVAIDGDWVRITGRRR